MEVISLLATEGNEKIMKEHSWQAWHIDITSLFSWLVTARHPTDNLLARARQSHFKVIGPQELPFLKKYVEAWVRAEWLVPFSRSKPASGWSTLRIQEVRVSAGFN
jgi:hypothetical protein